REGEESNRRDREFGWAQLGLACHPPGRVNDHSGDGRNEPHEGLADRGELSPAEIRIAEENDEDECWEDYSYRRDDRAQCAAHFVPRVRDDVHCDGTGKNGSERYAVQHLALGQQISSVDD